MKKSCLIFVHRNIDFATQKSLRTIIDVQCRAIVKLKSTKNVQTKGHLEVVQLPGSTYFVLEDLGGHYSGNSWYLGIGLCTVHISYCVYIHMFYIYICSIQRGLCSVVYVPHVFPKSAGPEI